ncbi:chromate resistance protein [Rhodobacter sp. Har01]|uniref:chromate resistance protein ChrB domain-containing protein n=1 Tax=Rhodobacter sp. Har01 TaxID=2883999 RepID=UPI001D09900D|nr:chromate resistance protein ChrB domain-containing protein [Rhodobacter sp. Har01]MCB6176669.1 chromate resistance protein [Rhodobacter sp. Har01]
MPGFGLILPAQAFRLIGTPDAPTVFDVRLPEDIAALPRTLPTARRVAHDAIATLAGPPGRAIVACTRGRKLSEGAAALLRTMGWQAEVLHGGTLAWAEAGLPMLPIAALPAPGTPWVTRHRPKIDRIACPWLIRRFINPAARFLFVTPAEVPAVAEHFGAIPFDIEDVPFSHRGAHCTFDALLDDFDLHTEALDRMALVIRGADTDRHELAPQAAGLLALSVGLSRMYRDDLAQLDAGIALYDALYRWARDGHEEGHDWPAGRRE